MLYRAYKQSVIPKTIHKPKCTNAEYTYEEHENSGRYRTSEEF